MLSHPLNGRRGRRVSPEHIRRAVAATVAQDRALIEWLARRERREVENERSGAT